jgi:hypothetical protein
MAVTARPTAAAISEQETTIHLPLRTRWINGSRKMVRSGAGASSEPLCQLSFIEAVISRHLGRVGSGTLLDQT